MKKKLALLEKKWEELTTSEIHDLRYAGILNGCGGTGGVSFDEILEIVEKLKYFDKVKFKKFHRELKEQCGKHDYKYYIGGIWYHKIMADLELSNWIFCNLTWADWYIAPMAWIGSMIGLTKKGKKYFNYTNNEFR